MIRAVVFDVGETLVDETREYGTWADWLGVPRHTFVAVFGAVIAQGRDYRETFQEFAPGFDLYAEREQRAAVGQPETFGEEDLYPDVRPALAALRERGLWLGIAGNQTTRAGVILRRLFADDVDLIGTSDDWGAHKPDTVFFERVAAAVPHRPSEILYVGDRVDVDVLPAKAVGMSTALIRRGPWGWVEWTYPRSLSEPTVRITSLAELPSAIDALGSASALDES
ncbi:HAD family hydrolase [Streptacidiphilus cavernicola]|uniref:HAD family hydrolase n=1 Tax=Streptacidiphilus cavernicola TaxID=3342716 RepID=A0ABV6VVQ1_9ACTN